MKITSYKKNGKTFYSFRASIGYKNGKQVRVYRSGFTTKKSAESEYWRLKSMYNETSDMLFRDFAEHFMQQYKLSVAPSSFYIKSKILYKNLLPLVGNFKLRDLKGSLFQTIVNDLVSSSNANGSIILFKQIMKKAVKKRVISENPFDFIDIPKRKKIKKNDNFYTKEELQKFLILAKTNLSYKWYVFFYVLAYTGMRKGELLALEVSDLKDNEISITKTVSTNGLDYISPFTKTTTSNRKILIDDKTRDLLLSLNEKQYFFFKNNLSRILIAPNNHLKKLKRKNVMKIISPHGFRHTHCALLFSAGVSLSEVQQRLGHKDIKTTLNIYNHVFEDDKALALEKFINFMR